MRKHWVAVDKEHRFEIEVGALRRGGISADAARHRLDAIVEALWGSELLLEWTEAHARAGEERVVTSEGPAPLPRPPRAHVAKRSSRTRRPKSGP